MSFRFLYCLSSLRGRCVDPFVGSRPHLDRKCLLTGWEATNERLLARISLLVGLT